MFVMTLHVIDEYHVPQCEPGSGLSFTRIGLMSRPDVTELPARVVGVCLPFVCVEPAEGKTRMLDTRGVRLARIDTRFAKLAMAPHAVTEDKDRDLGSSDDRGPGRKFRLRRKRF
jgi:hypothetical protein